MCFLPYFGAEYQKAVSLIIVQLLLPFKFIVTEAKKKKKKVNTKNLVNRIFRSPTLVKIAFHTGTKNVLAFLFHRRSH